MIKFDIENRVAVVTGGAQGFGLAITERSVSYTHLTLPTRTLV